MLSCSLICASSKCRDRKRERELAMASMLLLIVVIGLHFIAFSLAIAAKQRRSTVKVATFHEELAYDFELFYQYCHYNSDIATLLGLRAFALHLITQVLTMGVEMQLNINQ
ncbi:uncharacterized protein LOC112536738 [Ricinus communis]|uniref:uncharacterized protein LOC112536738 n=1 Tax=Ricinus communis TaxID=3988 RepID=UPI00201A709E|nr:uncharacterized protein LOC112536738 [Ricinus communis]